MKAKTAILTGLGIAAAAGLSTLAVGEVMWIGSLTKKGNELGQKLFANDEKFQSQFQVEVKPDVPEEPNLFETVPNEDVFTLNSLGEVACALFVANKTTDKWVILCHGYTSDPHSMEAYAKEYYKKGFNIIAPYMRGHEKGVKTNGHTCYTMGWYDRIDVLGWIDYCAAMNPESKIILHGESMGAATVMMTVGEPIPDNVVCAVEDCGYTSVWDEFSTQMKEMFRLPPMPFMYTSNFVSKCHINLDFKKASSLEQLKKSKTPMLFIHGEKDDFVPFEMVYKNYEAFDGEKDILTVPNAAHAVSVRTDPITYWKKVWEFAGKYVDLN